MPLHTSSALRTTIKGRLVNVKRFAPLQRIRNERADGVGQCVELQQAGGHIQCHPRDAQRCKSHRLKNNNGLGVKQSRKRVMAGSVTKRHVAESDLVPKMPMRKNRRRELLRNRLF